jgi:hypothetical protein
VATLQEKKEDRLRFIRRLYEKTDGSTFASAGSGQIGRELGWSKERTDLAVEYLVGHGLVKYVTMGGHISLMHAGVLEVEGALTHPDQPTAHFPPANIILVGEMHGSQIQQGTIQSQQGASTDVPSVDQLLAAADSLRALLPQLGLQEDERQEADAEIATAQSQLRSPRPKWDIIRGSLAAAVGILGQLGSVATGSAELAQALEKVHKALPGL